MNIVLLLVLLLSLGGVAAGEFSSNDMKDLSFWLLLAICPGIAMLVALGIRYRGTPSIDVQSNAPVKPPVEVEPNELEQFKRNTIEQLNVISAVLRNSTATILEADVSSATGRAPPSLQGSNGSWDSATATVHVEKSVETVSQTRLLELGSTIEAIRNGTPDKDFAELVSEMYKLTELASHLLDKRQALVHTAIGPLLAADNTTPNRHYLFFTLDDEPFAVSTQSIHSVVESTQLITKPSMPSKLRRAIRLHDALVPVIDLGAHLGGQPIEIGRSSSIVILKVTIGNHMQMIGVVVDEVSEILEICPLEIEPPAASDSQIRNDFILGTVTVNNHTITLLDMGRGFSANEFVALR